MKKRFIIGVDPTSKEQEKQFIEYLRGRGCGRWHWINNFWLVTDPSGKVTAKELRDELMRIAPEARILVLPVTPTRGWSGKGPRGPEKNMFDWLRNNWEED